MVEDVRKAIENAKLKYVEGIRKGDAAAVAAMFTEDAILLPQNVEMIRGRKGIEKFYGAAIQGGLKDNVFATMEVSGSGDIIHEVGDIASIVNQKGQNFEKKLKYVCIYKHDPSGWKVHRLIWNTNTPPQK